MNIDIEEIKNYYNNISLSDVVFLFPSNLLHETNLNDLNMNDIDLNETNQFKENKINQKYNILVGHRIILSLRSPLFYNTFHKNSSRLPSKNIRFPLKVIIQDTSYYIFNIILKYIYTNELNDFSSNDLHHIKKDRNQNNILSDIVYYYLNILYTAYAYKIPTLCNVCINKIINHLNPIESILLLSEIDQMKNENISENIYNNNNNIINMIQKCNDSLNILQENCIKIIMNIKLNMFKIIIEKIIHNKQIYNNERLTQVIELKNPNSPLILAIQLELIDIIDYLIKKNQSIDTPDLNGLYPLSAAIKTENTSIIRRIVMGNKYFLQDLHTEIDRISLLHIAVSTGSIINCKILIENYGTDIINCRIKKKISKNVSKRSTSILDKSIKNNKTYKNAIIFMEGQTPLHIACKYGYPEIVEYLLNHLAIPNLQDDNGNTALHFVNDIETAKKLLEGKNNVNMEIPNKRGQIPLHLISMNGDINLVDLLLRHNGFHNVPDDQGQTPFHYAAAAGNTGVLLILIKSLENTTMNDQMKTKKEIKVIEKTESSDETNESLKLEKNYNPEEKHIEERNRKEMIKEDKYDTEESIDENKTKNETIVNQNTNDQEVNTPPTSIVSNIINQKDAKGNTSLHLAAMAPAAVCEKTLYILLENGGNSNEVNWIGHTPLHLFCAHHDGPTSVIDLFVQHHGNIHIQGADGSTPLHLAVGKASEKIAIALLHAGANVYIQDAAGRSIIDLAETTCQGKLVVPIIQNIIKIPEWISNIIVTKCSCCGILFSVSMRKHHCRHCGRIACYNCTNNSISLIKFNLFKPVRVCNLCFDILSFRRLS